MQFLFSQVLPLLVPAAGTHDHDSNISKLPKAGLYLHILNHISPKELSSSWPYPHWVFSSSFLLTKLWYGVLRQISLRIPLTNCDLGPIPVLTLGLSEVTSALSFCSRAVLKVWFELSKEVRCASCVSIVLAQLKCENILYICKKIHLKKGIFNSFAF